MQTRPTLLSFRKNDAVLLGLVCPLLWLLPSVIKVVLLCEEVALDLCVFEQLKVAFCKALVSLPSHGCVCRVKGRLDLCLLWQAGPQSLDKVCGRPYL